jgi:hypothetical protein
VLVIGFGHRARQGKNTAAVALLNACPIDCRVRCYAYADALKAEVNRAISGAGGQEQLISTWQESGLMPTWVKPELGKPRTLLQWWGTDYRRAKDPNYWVKRLQDTLHREQPDIALITDVRFPNEVEAIHALGGKVVKVTRIGKPDFDVPAHPSEDILQDYAGWDYHLQASTATELRQKAAALYTQIAEGK